MGISCLFIGCNLRGIEQFSQDVTSRMAVYRLVDTELFLDRLKV
jgi:hypothetical protein